VWLGDNTYLREADWSSRSGILHRYTHTRAYSGLQPLLASTHHYATWDDHDYGPNNSDRSYWGKGLAREAFELFWPNPSYGMPGIPGIATVFEWADTLFVLLDDRTNRSPNNRETGERTMLGDAQVEWLIDTLVSSTATLKFVAVGGQFLNPNDGFETFATFPKERERILRLLEAERIPGVFFLTGDRHRTELSKLERPGLYRYTTSRFHR
jgi:alkaline phosphatase D